MSKQGTLIYIEKDSITEAEFMSRNFINNETKNRVFINTIGAELVMKYLNSEGFDVSELFNLHSMSKIIEGIDIADILLRNIHIDVRTVFDRKQIFIPKSHFQLGITPDVYVVIIPNESFNHAEIIGYFTPQQIDKNDSNNDYYFISEDKLAPIDTLTKYIKDFTGKVEQSISESDFLRGRELAVKIADHNINIEDKMELLGLLLSSKALRESVLEFDNFETLAYNTVEQMQIIAPDFISHKQQETDYFTEFEENPEPQDFNNEQNPTSEEEESSTEEDVEEKLTLEDEELILDNSFFDEFETTTTEDFFETLTDDNEIIINSEEQTPSETMPQEEMFTLLGDYEDSTPASSEAIKLAGVAGDTISDLLEQNIDKQQEPFSVIDYENINIDNQNVQENFSSIIPPQNELDMNDDFEQPTNLSDLKTVDISHLQEPEFEHETIDLHAMQPIETENFTEHTDNIINFDSITSNNSPTIPVENLEELIQTNSEEDDAVDLADLSTMTFDETLETDIDFQEDNLEPVDSNEITQDEDSSTDNNKDETETNQENLETEELDLNDIEDLDNLETLDEELSLDFDDEELATTLQEDSTPESFESGQDKQQPQSEIIEDDNVIQHIEEEEDKKIEDTNDVINIENSDETQEINYDQNFEFADIELPDSPQQDENIKEKSDIEDSMETGTDDDSFDNLEEYNIADATIDNAIVAQEDTLNDDAEQNIDPEQNSEISIDLDENIETEIIANNIEQEAEIQPSMNDEEQQKQFVPLGYENSTVISDKTFTIGEIPIDINSNNRPVLDGHESLESIYNEANSTTSMLNTPGRTGKVIDNKKGLGLIGSLLVLILVCGIGFGVAKLFKAPNEEPLQPITDDIIPTTTTTDNTTQPEAIKVDPNNVVKMNETTGTTPVATTQIPKPQKITEPKVTAQKTTPAQTSQNIPVTTFLEVRKLTWEVPDYVSFAPQFKQYFQSAGKSLKLSLTSDLLLATEPSYSKEIKVTITYNRNGDFKDAKMLKSSGSTQIDNIVLQTVNQTLKVLKAPVSLNNDDSTTAILKIYF